MKKRVKKFLKEQGLFLSILLAIFLWAIYSYSNQGVIHSLFTSDSQGIINFVNSFGIFAAVIFVLLVMLEVVLAPIPPLIL